MIRKLTIWKRLYQVVVEVRVVNRVHGPIEHLRHFVAFQFYRIHPSYAEISLAQMDLSRTVALSFQMYSLSKDIYDKWVLYKFVRLIMSIAVVHLFGNYIIQFEVNTVFRFFLNNHVIHRLYIAQFMVQLIILLFRLQNAEKSY